MEYLDICDSKGKLTGKIASKKEAHEKGFWHRCVHVWIVNYENEILIQKRSDLVKNNPNKWDISAAGHMSSGENHTTSALREIAEELGLKIKAEELVQIAELKRSSKKEGYINNEINRVYVIRKDINIDDIQHNHEEVSELKFISYKKLLEMIPNNDPQFVSHPEEYALLFEYLSKQ